MNSINIIIQEPVFFLQETQIRMIKVYTNLMNYINIVTKWPKEKQRLTKHTHKTKYQVTLTSLKTGGELRCCGRVSSSCSTSESSLCHLLTLRAWCSLASMTFRYMYTSMTFRYMYTSMTFRYMYTSMTFRYMYTTKEVFLLRSLNCVRFVHKEKIMSMLTLTPLFKLK
jgi:hypothetical protein